MGRNTSGMVGVTLAMWTLVLMSAGRGWASLGEPGLVGHWKLDGNASDSAGNHPGVVVGNPTWVNDPQRGWCLDLDGNGDYVDVGDDPSLTFGEAITVACWIKVLCFERNWSAIVTKGDDWVLARTRDDNRVAFLCLGLTGGGWPEVYSGDVNDGNWHHIAGTYDGAKLYLYQDGSCADSKALRGSINHNWSRVLIGENGQCSTATGMASSTTCGSTAGRSWPRRSAPWRSQSLLPRCCPHLLPTM